MPAPASAAEDAGVTRSARKRSQTGVRVRGQEEPGLPAAALGTGSARTESRRTGSGPGAGPTAHRGLLHGACRRAVPWSAPDSARTPGRPSRCLSEEDTGQAAPPLSCTPGTLRRTVRLCLHPDPPHSPPSWSCRDVFLSPTAAIPVLEPAAPVALSDLPPDHFSSGLRRDGADSTRTPLRPTASPGCPCSLVFPSRTRALRKQRAGPQQAFQRPLNTPRGPELQSPSRLGSAHQGGRGRAARRARVLACGQLRPKKQGSLGGSGTTGPQV